MIPCNTAAQHALLPGFAVADISTITETGMQSLGRTAVAFARSRSSPANMKLYMAQIFVTMRQACINYCRQSSYREAHDKSHIIFAKYLFSEIMSENA